MGRAGVGEGDKAQLWHPRGDVKQAVRDGSGVRGRGIKAGDVYGEVMSIRTALKTTTPQQMRREENEPNFESAHSVQKLSTCHQQPA